MSDLGGDPACWAHLFEHETACDITDARDVRGLLVDFYRAAMMDDLLGPVFEGEVADWEHHIDTVTAFWVWQLLGERGYEGQPLRAHEPLHRRTPLTGPMFERWVQLFCDTVDSRFQGSVAEVAKARGRKMAAAMERLLAGESDSGSEEIGVTMVVTPASAASPSARSH